MSGKPPYESCPRCPKCGNMPYRDGYLRVTDTQIPDDDDDEKAVTVCMHCSSFYFLMRTADNVLKWRPPTQKEWEMSREFIEPIQKRFDRQREVLMKIKLPERGH